MSADPVYRQQALKTAYRVAANDARVVLVLHLVRESAEYILLRGRSSRH
jgi:hypothetical protein